MRSNHTTSPEPGRRDHECRREDPDREETAAALRELFRAPGEAVREETFDRLALAVFRRQRRACEPYRLLCEAAGVSEAEEDLSRIPFVPTDAFKHYRLACFDPRPDEVRFRTSGTTRERAGIHHLPDTALYDAAAMPWLARHLLPEITIAEAGAYPVRFDFLSLTLSPAEAPSSSLVHMIDTAGRVFARGGGGGDCVRYFYGQGGVDSEGLTEAILAARESDVPVMLFTTAFALVHLLDSGVGAGDGALALPPGSRIMETGGYKGRSRAVGRDELYSAASDRFGIPTRAIVNEYGMTEMSSQFYDRTLSEPDMAEAEARIKIPPPWVRSLIVDPVTFQPVGEGETGLLLHIDLANPDSCAFLMTSDAATRRGAGFELLGRMADATPRGCSLDYEEIAG